MRPLLTGFVSSDDEKEHNRLRWLGPTPVVSHGGEPTSRQPARVSHAVSRCPVEPARVPSPANEGDGTNSESTSTTDDVMRVGNWKTSKDLAPSVSSAEPSRWQQTSHHSESVRRRRCTWATVRGMNRPPARSSAWIRPAFSTAAFGLRWSRCPCRSLRTNSCLRRCVPVRVRSRSSAGPRRCKGRILSDRRWLYYSDDSLRSDPAKDAPLAVSDEENPRRSRGAIEVTTQDRRNCLNPISSCPNRRSPPPFPPIYRTSLFTIGSLLFGHVAVPLLLRTPSQPEAVHIPTYRCSAPASRAVAPSAGPNSNADR